VEKDFFQGNGPPKQAEVTTLITDKVDFRLKSVRRDNEGHIILIKGTFHQEEIKILNINTSNIGTPNYAKKKKIDLKSQIDPNTVIVGELQYSTVISK
jgi:hypothetical protein